VLAGSKVDDVGVGERIAGAGIDYGHESGRRLLAPRRFASCDRKTGEGEGDRESQKWGVARQGTGGLPLFQRIAARMMANISPKIIPILMGPPLARIIV
jgi:hypothetical protein